MDMKGEGMNILLTADTLGEPCRDDEIHGTSPSIIHREDWDHHTLLLSHGHSGCSSVKERSEFMIFAKEA
jgi:hypothetical protein